MLAADADPLLARHCPWAHFPFWVQAHSDRRVEQEVGVALDLRQELTPAGLEVQDQQQLVPVRRGQVARDCRAVHRRAVCS